MDRDRLSVRVDVMVMVRVNRLLVSDYVQDKLRVVVRIMVILGLGLGLYFDPNNLLTLTPTITRGRDDGKGRCGWERRICDLRGQTGKVKEDIGNAVE